MSEYLQELGEALLGLDYAIGGAVAQAMHGYGRMTSDIDVFVQKEGARAVLKALRGRGFVIEPIHDSMHYAAHLPRFEHLYPEVRVDILVAHADPEWSAVALPNELTFQGVKLRVMPVELLALTRFYSTEPRHRADLAQLLERRLFDVTATTRILRRMDTESATAWHELLKELRTPIPARPRPRRSR